RIIASLIIMIIGIILIFNASLFQISSTYRTVKSQFSSVLMGALTSVAWAPCYGAYLIALIAYNVSTGNLGYTIINLTLFTLGFSLTLMIIAFLISKINLKKIIQYSNWIRIISGIIIFTAGLYLLLNLFGIIILQ
ncbi:MAG: cytochrome c biogenesis protein CcdA, partial [Methanobacterium sp.]|nr:cytochrome c biogenesis protein CcdA [Methanobacterium sp.]